MARYRIDEGTAPFAMMVRRSGCGDSVSVLHGLLESRKTGQWQSHSGRKSGVRARLAELLSGQPAGKPSAEGVVANVFNIGAGVNLQGGPRRDQATGRSMSPSELYDAAVIIDELSRSVVPDFNGSGDNAIRSVFFSPTRGWYSPFPNLRAAWTQAGKAVVFYGWGWGQMFEAWAVAFKPGLSDWVRVFWTRPVVVVPAIVPMIPRLRRVLMHEHRQIWQP